jgi:hypothetical protein
LDRSGTEHAQVPAQPRWRRQWRGVKYLEKKWCVRAKAVGEPGGAEGRGQHRQLRAPARRLHQPRSGVGGTCPTQLLADHGPFPDFATLDHGPGRRMC